jgi:hypothetical protein
MIDFSILYEKSYWITRKTARNTPKSHFPTMKMIKKTEFIGKKPLIKLETTSLAELVDIEKKTINKIGFE